jgi:hypothetical protein
MPGFACKVIRLLQAVLVVWRLSACVSMLSLLRGVSRSVLGGRSGLFLVAGAVLTIHLGQTADRLLVGDAVVFADVFARCAKNHDDLQLVMCRKWLHHLIYYTQIKINASGIF